jgi:hypothetical protein
MQHDSVEGKAKDDSSVAHIREHMRIDKHDRYNVGSS